MQFGVVACIINFLFLSISCVAGLTNSGGESIVPRRSYRNPCPRRQLLCYLGHIGGSKNNNEATEVYVRSKIDNDQKNWQKVGKIVAAGLEKENLSTTKIRSTMIRAAQYQQRLIVEHWRRLYSTTRKVRGDDEIELGILLPEGSSSSSSGIKAIEWALPDDFLTRLDMIQCGFAGNDYDDVTTTADGSRKKRTIYSDFWANNGAKRYDRKSIRTEVNKIVVGTKTEQEIGNTDVSTTLTQDDEVVILAWKNCGYARKARKLLQDRNIEYTDVVIDKYSPIHAELTLMTGRTSVPYIYVGGEFIGGCNPDGELSGLVGIIDDIWGATTLQQ